MLGALGMHDGGRTLEIDFVSWLFGVDEQTKDKGLMGSPFSLHLAKCPNEMGSTA